MSADLIVGTSTEKANEPMSERWSEVGLWQVEVVVAPKPGVNDPEGESILRGLRALGHEGVEGIKAGRHFEVGVTAATADAARAAVEAMCDTLLANPVIETYRVTVRPSTPSRDPVPPRVEVAAR
jgi:phosphoribosylformylglycinamidine synthase subunit PurS